MDSIEETTPISQLMDEFKKLVMAHRPASRQERCFKRMLALTLVMEFRFGRHTITQMLLTLGLTDTDHSAMYRLFSRQSLEVSVLNRCLSRETVQHVGKMNCT